jgi:uncharacterized pyridoxal phosphate-containing UPF0001 family protein
MAAVTELVEKASVLPRAIDWHFIGQLQTNKCKQLAEKVPNLWAVESVDAKKKADALDKGRASLLRTTSDVGALRVYVQVNTSGKTKWSHLFWLLRGRGRGGGLLMLVKRKPGEESKSGCDPAEAPALAKHIVDACKHLTLQGVMTIGAIARSKASDVPNEDFLLLRKTRDHVAAEVGVEPESLELSMGMSEDFEQAVELGSSNVRCVFFSHLPRFVYQMCNVWLGFFSLELGPPSLARDPRRKMLQQRMRSPPPNLKLIHQIRVTTLHGLEQS